MTVSIEELAKALLLRHQEEATLADSLDELQIPKLLEDCLVQQLQEASRSQAAKRVNRYHKHRADIVAIHLNCVSKHKNKHATLIEHPWFVFGMRRR